MTREQVLALIQGDPRVHALLIAFTGIVLALIVSTFVDRVLHRLAQRTAMELDDALVEHLRGPIAASIALAGFWYALEPLTLPAPLPYFARGVILSAVVVTWTGAAARMVMAVLQAVGRKQQANANRSRLLPVFDIVGRTLIFGAALYFFFLAWDIDVTAWLASAGIIGIAVGFAAQESLSNLFAGLIILADAPYKVGDWLTLDTGERGRVTEIGVKSTRLLTLDDMEIIVPNRVMGNATIVNESGGPYEMARVTCNVSAAYGSDVGLVREVLHASAHQIDNVSDTPAPRVQFVEFGDSGLHFKLLVWTHPRHKNVVLDALNVRVYQAFNTAGIEIPFPKRDLYIRSAAPAQAPAPSEAARAQDEVDA